MRHLKLTIVGLLLGLSLVFYIERWNFGQPGVLSVQPFVYPLGLIAAVVIILAPIFSRVTLLTTVLTSLGAFMLLKLLVFNDVPWIGDVYTYITVTEMGLVALLVALAYQVRTMLQEFSQAVEFVTLAGGSAKVSSLDQAGEQINAEMNRSRHYNRSLSIILATLDPHDIQTALPRLFLEAQEKVMRQYMTARLAETIRSELRRMDMVLEDPQNSRVIVLSPEVDGRGSTVLLERLNGAVGKKLGIRLQSGAASYPHMALTFEDLVQEAEMGMGRNTILQFEDSSGVAD